MRSTARAPATDFSALDLRVVEHGARVGGAAVLVWRRCDASCRRGRAARSERVACRDPMIQPGDQAEEHAGDAER